MDRTRFRWRICALLFFATTINYLDRQVLGLLKPELAMRFNWTETEYSYMVVVFTACYAIGLILSGKLVDKYGVKLGYGICVLVWSIAACGHSLVRNTLGFSFMRALLGLAESGNFPAAVKAVSEWFPRREQALAVGILTSGTSIGAVAAPALVPWLAASYGWQAAFLVTGLTGFVWLGFWYLMYYAPQKHKAISVEELKYINENRAGDDDKGPSVNWISLLKIRPTWAFVMGKLLTDPIWWFMLFWLPSYFSSRYHLDLKNLGLPLVVVYVATSIGSISGGWLSSRLIARGWDVTRARQITMLGLAFLVVPIAFSPWIDNMWAMVGLLSLAAAAHQGWSANLFTTASDMFPKRLVGSIVGMGGMAGAIGGTVFPLFVGALLDHFKALGNVNAGYNILFAICGSAYVIAWTIMRLIRSSNPRTDLGSMPADSVT
ncbi:MFS transporter, ACS family, hexuronate transporter [Paraburkholderia steynii]|uniref:MFS transporter, ACS family, hexuronate transporter n=1 Tax=Paraburkholderia steynii TaxID=1245441 RepID=A0A7Z7BEG8_9BURK|nr:MFS transporter [Paraburkholderia steynii]SDJ02596.1 MFS transporter, ACS family, hexuronate transporter [Paraburkholderia steynii]